MGKQNTPLILGFVNNAARNAWGVSQKQVQNQKQTQNQKTVQKPVQQKNTPKQNQKNTQKQQSFESWATVVSRNSSKNNTNNVLMGPMTKQQAQQQKAKQQQVQQQQQKTKQQQVQQQQQKTKQQQVKQQQQQKTKQNNKSVVFGPITKQQYLQQQQLKKQQKKQQQQQSQIKKQFASKGQQTETFGWYPPSKQQYERQQYEIASNAWGRSIRTNNKNNTKNNTPKKHLAKPFNTNVYNTRQYKEYLENQRSQLIWKSINHLYDAANYTFPSENNRGAWISNKNVGSDKVLSVATLFAIRNAPKAKGGNGVIRRRGQLIFTNNIRRAVEGKHVGHKKFRTNRVVTNIPAKYLNGSFSTYAKTQAKIQNVSLTKNSLLSSLTHNYSKVNGPKRAEKVFSFKGVY